MIRMPTYESCFIQSDKCSYYAKRGAAQGAPRAALLHEPGRVEEKRAIYSVVEAVPIRVAHGRLPAAGRSEGLASHGA